MSDTHLAKVANSSMPAAQVAQAELARRQQAETPTAPPEAPETEPQLTQALQEVDSRIDLLKKLADCLKA
jgi:hypothetical protein